jgi:hypothetical protein
MNKVLQKAIKARDDFLKKHPKYQSYQNEIDEIMEKVGPDPGTRLEVLAQLAEGNMIELQVQMGLLNKAIQKTTENIKNNKIN